MRDRVTNESAAVGQCELKVLRARVLAKPLISADVSRGEQRAEPDVELSSDSTGSTGEMSQIRDARSRRRDRRREVSPLLLAIFAIPFIKGRANETRTRCRFTIADNRGITFSLPGSRMFTSARSHQTAHYRVAPTPSRGRGERVSYLFPVGGENHR